VIETRPATACELLAERVLGVTGVPAPELDEVVALRVFDTLGALASAVGAHGASVPGDHAWGGGADAGVLGTVRRLCALTRSSEVDDIERRSCTTPGSVAVPVALALAGERPVSGPTLLAAVAAGYETMVAIGEAVDGAFILYRGIWPSYLAAPLAAAATTARLLELDRSRFVDALAIAAARVVGIAGRPPREPSSRWFLYGCAAAEGVASALAAAGGVAGDPAVLETVLGLQTQDDFREIRSSSKLPAVARVDVKPYCTARQVQSATEGARRAWGQLNDATVDAIIAIEVAVPEPYRSMIDQPRPSDRLSSIMSAQFQIAAALHDPARLYDVARTGLSLSGAGAAIGHAVSVVADPELTSLFPALWPAQVRVRLRDSREACARVLDPDGARAPGPGWDWLEDKHAALGGLGDALPAVAGTCRALHADAPAPARALLDLALHSPHSLTSAAYSGGTP